MRPFSFLKGHLHVPFYGAFFHTKHTLKTYPKTHHTSNQHSKGAFTRKSDFALNLQVYETNNKFSNAFSSKTQHGKRTSKNALAKTH